MKTDLGEPEFVPRIFIDGRELAGQALRQALEVRGARGLGVREVPVVVAPADPITDILREIFAKVVEGGQPENTRVTNKKPETFERGRVCADYAGVVRKSVVPLLLRRKFLEPTLDRHGTVRLVRGRLKEVVDFLFRGVSSEDLEEVARELREAIR
jgi:hypothetical protein